MEQIKGMLTSLKVEILDPVVVKGYPKEGDLRALNRLAEEIMNKHRGLGIIGG